MTLITIAKKEYFLNSMDLNLQPGKADYQARRRVHWDAVAKWFEAPSILGRAYYDSLREIDQLRCHEKRRVIAFACGAGDLLG